jgi:starch synthase (maltosyl-transferring)
MYRLAKVGYSQSYTYFTWRHTKQEFIDYMTELSTTAVQDFFRPHFFVNTPDINPVFLQRSGRPGFLIRAALATLLSGLWGMYSGFELCEATPVPGKEDYLDSEKYEIRAWDWQRPGNIITEITALNRIRSAHPALQSHLGVTFCDSSDPNMLCFLRHERQPADETGLGEDVIFVAINLDPFGAHDTSVSLPLWRLGLPDHGTLDVDDLIHGNRFTLQGQYQQLRLDPGSLPYAVWRLSPHREIQ